MPISKSIWSNSSLEDFEELNDQDPYPFYFLLETNEDYSVKTEENEGDNKVKGKSQNRCIVFFKFLFAKISKWNLKNILIQN